MFLFHRELVADLFGGDGEPLGTAEEELPGEPKDGEKPEKEVKVMVKSESNLSSSIPDDPFDIHGQEEQKHKAPVWVDDDDFNIRQGFLSALLHCD